MSTVLGADSQAKLKLRFKWECKVSPICTPIWVVSPGRIPITNFTQDCFNTACSSRCFVRTRKRKFHQNLSIATTKRKHSPKNPSNCDTVCCRTITRSHSRTTEQEFQ